VSGVSDVALRGPAPSVTAAASAAQRRASAGSFRQSLLFKKKPLTGGKKTAPMSYITGIRPPSSKHHAKRFNGVLPKYGVQPANADQLAEVGSVSIRECPSFPV